jgi:hypothetical protein
MIRFALPLCAFAAMGLAACTTYYDPPPAAPVTTTSGAPVVSAASSAPVVSSGSSAYRPGSGIVESISLVSLPASAAAGGTLPPVVSGPYRITMRMDDGSNQTLVVNNRAFLVGDRVQITSDGRLTRS